MINLGMYYRIRTIMREHNIWYFKSGIVCLTYKENDDTRESPTLQLLERMDEHLAFGVKVFDPFIKPESDIIYEPWFQWNQIIVIMVAHDHIKENMDLLKIN